MEGARNSGVQFRMSFDADSDFVILQPCNCPVCILVEGGHTPHSHAHHQPPPVQPTQSAAESALGSGQHADGGANHEGGTAAAVGTTAAAPAVPAVPAASDNVTVDADVGSSNVDADEAGEGDGLAEDEAEQDEAATLHAAALEWARSLDIRVRGDRLRQLSSLSSEDGDASTLDDGSDVRGLGLSREDQWEQSQPSSHKGGRKKKGKKANTVYSAAAQDYVKRNATAPHTEVARLEARREAVLDQYERSRAAAILLAERLRQEGITDRPHPSRRPRIVRPRRGGGLVEVAAWQVNPHLIEVGPDYGHQLAGDLGLLREHTLLLEQLQHREITPEDYALLSLLDNSITPKCLQKKTLMLFPTGVVVAVKKGAAVADSDLSNSYSSPDNADVVVAAATASASASLLGAPDTSAVSAVSATIPASASASPSDLPVSPNDPTTAFAASTATTATTVLSSPIAAFASSASAPDIISTVASSSGTSEPPAAANYAPSIANTATPAISGPDEDAISASTLSPGVAPNAVIPAGIAAAPADAPPVAASADAPPAAASAASFSGPAAASASAAETAVTATTVAARRAVREFELEGEMCVICMEEFRVGESVRELPCLHVYHMHCVDEWLSTASCNCPADGLSLEQHDH